MLEISKKEIDKIVADINKKKIAVKIDTKAINNAADEVLKN
jgi:hypothetical protein